MITLSIPTGKLLVIPEETLPEDIVAIDKEVTDKESLPLCLIVYQKDPNGFFKPGLPLPIYPLPPGSWSLLGKASELTDRLCDYEANGIKENDILLIEIKQEPAKRFR